MEQNYKLIEFSWSLFVWQMFILASLILLIYCLKDLLNSDFKGNEKTIWFLTILFIPFGGSVLYLIIGRNKSSKRKG